VASDKSVLPFDEIGIVDFLVQLVMLVVVNYLVVFLHVCLFPFLLLDTQLMHKLLHLGNLLQKVDVIVAKHSFTKLVRLLHLLQEQSTLPLLPLVLVEIPEENTVANGHKRPHLALVLLELGDVFHLGEGVEDVTGGVDLEAFLFLVGGVLFGGGDGTQFFLQISNLVPTHLLRRLRIKLRRIGDLPYASWHIHGSEISCHPPLRFLGLSYRGLPQNVRHDEFRVLQLLLDQLPEVQSHAGVYVLGACL